MSTFDKLHKTVSIMQQFICERIDPALRVVMDAQLSLVESFYKKRDETALKQMRAELLLLVAEMNPQEQIELGKRFRAEGLILELGRNDQKAQKIIGRKMVRNREEYEILKSFFERCVLGHSTDVEYTQEIDRLLMDYREDGHAPLS